MAYSMDDKIKTTSRYRISFSDMASLRAFQVAPNLIKYGWPEDAKIIESDTNFSDLVIDALIESTIHFPWTEIDARKYLIEVDAPQMSYFEYLENGKTKRVIYKHLAMRSRNVKQLILFMDSLLQRIRSQDIKIIYWRWRPKIEWNSDPDMDNFGMYYFDMRLETEPELPNSFWEDTGCLTGEGETIRELIIKPKDEYVRRG